ncbi:MAG: 30S ribosomal protein S3 [Nanoarchaeota archaeon]
MIERKFVSQNIKEYQIKEYINQSLNKAGLSDVKLVRTPLGEKIIISASRPGLVVGRFGANISKLTKDLKKKFNLENPQIELDEVRTPMLDANIVAESIASALERFGSSRFKGVGHKAMTEVMESGALGVEILISGKIPSSRAKTWRFYRGYLKKCGDLAIMKVKKASVQANLKSGIVGIKVRILPGDVILPDKVTLREEKETIVEEVPPAAVQDEEKKEAQGELKEKEHAEPHKTKERKKERLHKDTPKEKDKQ